MKSYLRNPIALAVAAVTFFFTSFAYAETWTIPKVIELAEQNSTSMKTAREDYKKAENQVKQAWATVLPQINLEAGYTKLESYQSRVSSTGIANAFMGFASGLGTMQQNLVSLNALVTPTLNFSYGREPLPSLPSSSEGYSLKLSATQILFGMHVMPAIKAASEALTYSNIAMNKARQELHYSVIDQFFAVTKLKAQIGVTRESLKLLNTQRDRLAEMVKAGLATKTDLMAIDVQLLRTDMGIRTLARTLQLAQNALNITVGQPVDLINGTSSTANIAVDAPGTDADRLIAAAYDSRPDLQSLEITARLTTIGVDATAAAGFPMVFLVGSYGYQSNTRFTVEDANKDWMIALSLKWNVFDGFSTESKVKSAQSDVQKLQDGIASLKNVIKMDVEDSIAGYQTAVQSLAISKQATDLAGERLAMMNERFRNGLETNTEVMSAQLAYIQAKTDLVNASYDVMLAKFKLKKAIGQI